MISVIIPYVKDRGYLGRAIDSIMDQTYPVIEIIPVKEDRTQGANINRGLYKARGFFIKILHDDDILPPDSLDNLLMGITGYDFVCGDQETFGDSTYCPEPKVYKGRAPDFREMLEENHIYGGTTLYRKSVLLEVGGYDEALWTGEEYDLHLRLLKHRYRCNYIPRVVHKYRLHEFNKSYYMSPKEKEKRMEYIREIAKRNG